MTRAQDAMMAATCGAGYVGVIFAGGPRNQTAESARRVLDAAPSVVKRVGVVSDHSATEIADLVDALGLAAVQLHADPSADRIRDVAEHTTAEVWAVVRVQGSRLPSHARELAAVADAIVLDALAPNGLGGTGVALPWEELSGQIDRLAAQRVVIAGGLRPENVADAIAILAPDVVDVSSGVESAPGIKDHLRMRLFRDAVRRAEVSERR
jgi:phosphoribosylanthranilate isomerase